MEYKPSPYVTWIKHLSDYRSDSNVLVKKDESLEILVHPGHKPLCVPHTVNLYEVIDKEDKTAQLYFYSLAWVIPVLTQGDEENIAAALGLIESIVNIAPEEERSGAWNMLWDDHAVCERLCVIIELLSNSQSLSSINKDKFERHLEKTYHYIVKLVASDRWLNNNHRLFHFLASFVYHHHKGDNEKIDEFVDHISSFCHDLIDVETGFAREQCISYCFFDINVVEKVIKTLSALLVKIDFDVDKVHRNLLSHINAIAFPDHTLPASGDTPYGLKLSDFQKKHAIPYSQLHEHWKRLENLGFYRGESESKDVQFLMLEHNAESGHGHHSPLHVDVWFSNFGPVLVDSGGPYKYGDNERYNWFRASCGHNSLSFHDVAFYPHSKIHISTAVERNGVTGFLECNDATHCRNISVDNESLVANEFIFSDKEWKIYYNFAPGLSLRYLSNDKRHIELKNNQGEALILSISSGNINIDIESTKRCTGHALSELAPSIIISSSPGAYFFSLKISRQVIIKS